MASVIDKNLEPPPIQEPFIVDGEISNVWLQFFENIKDKGNLNTSHATSNGSSHTFIDQDVTTTSSPTFAGLTVDSRDVLRYMYLVAG